MVRRCQILKSKRKSRDDALLPGRIAAGRLYHDSQVRRGGSSPIAGSCGLSRKTPPNGNSKPNRCGGLCWKHPLAGILRNPHSTTVSLSLRMEPAARLKFHPEPGLTLTARQEPATGDRLAILLDFAGAEQANMQPIAIELRRRRMERGHVGLGAHGKLANASDKIGRAPDHNTAEWSMWIGRPLLGQWVVDVRRTLDAIVENSPQPPVEVACVGVGPAGAVAVCAAALDERIQRVAAVNMLSSLVTDVPYEGQRLGILVPGILRDVGDISHLVSLVAPGGLSWREALRPAAKYCRWMKLGCAYQSAETVWKLLQADQELRLVDPQDTAAIVAALK